MSLPFCRSYMFVSTSRTIGKKISPGVSSKSGIGPTLIIWWTAGVSGIAAPAIFAIRGLQTPQQTKTYSRLDRALVGVHAPDAAVLDVDPGHLGARGDGQRAEGLSRPRASACRRAASRRSRRRACRSRRG